LTQHVQIVREPLTYEPTADTSYFNDLYRYQRKGDATALKRLQRHAEEMRVEIHTRPELRALNSTDSTGGEFIPPLWMMEEWVPMARASRPFANAVTRRPLPGHSDSVVIPIVTGGSATATQQDGGGVQSTDPTTSSISVPVCTIAGQVDVSRQFFDRALPGADTILFDDLVRDYATKLDMQCLAGSGTSGQAKGVYTNSNVISVTWTSSTPTVPTLYPKFADAIQQIHTNRYASPTAVVMHPRRWAWILSSLDANNRPLVLPNAGQGAFNAMALAERVGAENIVGSIHGLPVILDASISTTLGSGTNQDYILVLRVEDLYLFEEGAPHQAVFQEVLSNTLQVRLQVYGYFAFTSERYSKASAKIVGTGLSNPTF
jgi:HK97 family phage major capsid protein